MDAHTAKVLPETGFHKGAGGRLERLSAPATPCDLPHRTVHAAGWPGRLPLGSGATQLFFLSTASARPATGTLALDHRQAVDEPLHGTVAVVLLGLVKHPGALGWAHSPSRGHEAEEC